MQSPDFRELSRQHPLREKLKQYGIKIHNNGKFCCPFHDDKHPSANVFKCTAGYELGQCHVCSLTFDTVELTARMENVGLQEAAKLLAGFKPMKQQPIPEDDAPTFAPGPIPEDQLPKPGRELRYINSKGKESRTTPSAVYVYRSPDGVAQGVVVRVEKTDGGKATWPIRWDAQKGRLVGKGWSRDELGCGID